MLAEDSGFPGEARVSVLKVAPVHEARGAEPLSRSWHGKRIEE
jgi:hypothetical protein